MGSHLWGHAESDMTEVLRLTGQFCIPLFIFWILEAIYLSIFPSSLYKSIFVIFYAACICVYITVDV